jgi:hypothetical protein
MKKVLPLLLLLFPLLLAAEDEKLAELVTLDGKTYQAVTIRKVEPDGLSILHAAGTAKVPFEKLPEELREKYGYDAAAAAEHRKQAAEAQRKQDATARAASEKRKKAAAAQAATEADKDFADKLQKAAKMVDVDAFQNSSIGLIGDIQVGTLTTEPVKSSMGSTIGHKPAWVFRGRAIDGVIAGTTGARAGIVSDDTGLPYGLPSTHKTVISWKGKAWRIGKIEYQNLRGLTVTVPYFTASEKVAAAFYRKNGFSPKSDEVTQESR